MKKYMLSFICFVCFSMAIIKPSNAELFGGVEFPDGEASFADEVVSYSPSSGVSSPYNDPSNALGIPGGNFTSLGDEGVLIVKFTNNSLTTSGDNTKDLWVFEVGEQIEPTSVAISSNGNDWIKVGSTSGSTSGIDIDAYIGSGVIAGEKYSFVKITDLLPHQSGSPYTGADIDAVGAISSSEAVTLIANAGADQIVFDKITLDGSGSYDQNNSIVSYQWQIKHRENSVYNKNAEGKTVTVESLEKGFYDVSLTVTNGENKQSTDNMVFSATGIMCDVNGDRKTSLEEAIHALQIVAGMKD